jgi:alginate O-acetyltransferase complex protein AlgI
VTFASIPFLFYFLPLTLAAYWATPWKNAVLLAASLVFYAWGEPVYVLALVALCIVNHAIGHALYAGRSRALLAVGIALNLAPLLWFKYLAFFAENLGLLLGAAGAPPALTTEMMGLEIRLPLGISFFTFHAISLLVDLWRRTAPPPRGWADTTLYIALFPQLIAGPIVRYKTVAHQLVARRHSALRFAFGARLFILGLAQKVLLANTFAAPADAAFSEDPALLTAGAAWLGAVFYALQIYFDFAGYSNMALGLGRMVGFRLPRNFNFPYTAQSVTEFWRRWHMTLSAWFRDYVYIPLGGNRRGPLRTYANLLIVFLLCGLWHGAAWAFVFWGLLHGLFLVFERSPAGVVVRAAPRVLRHAYLMLVVLLAWVPFRTEDLGAAIGYYGAMFSAPGDRFVDASQIALDDTFYVLAVGLAAALYPLWRGAVRTLGRLARGLPRGAGAAATAGRALAAQATTAALLLASAALLAGGAYNPFIYFRF